MIKKLLLLVVVFAVTTSMISCGKKTEKQTLIDYIKSSEDIFKTDKTLELMKDTTKKEELNKYMEEKSKDLLKKANFANEDSARAIFQRYQSDSDVVKAVNEFNSTYEKVMTDVYKTVYGKDPHQEMQQAPNDSIHNQQPKTDAPNK